MYLINYLTHSLCKFVVVLNFIYAQALTLTFTANVQIWG